MVATGRIKLKDESQILYDWLCLNGAGDELNVDLRKFKDWIETHTGQVYSVQQLREAVDELERYELVEVKAEQVKMKPKDMDTEKFDLGF